MEVKGREKMKGIELMEYDRMAKGWKRKRRQRVIRGRPGVVRASMMGWNHLRRKEDIDVKQYSKTFKVDSREESAKDMNAC